MNPLKLSILLVSAATLAACSAPTDAPEDSEASNEDALINAPRDTANTWSVGVCSSELNTDPTQGAIGACVVRGTRCSGSLVGPNLVLTARHCVQDPDFSAAEGFCDAQFKVPETPRPYRVTLAPSVLDANIAWLDVAEVITPPGASACDDDVVLLRLVANVPAADATPIGMQLAQTNALNKPRKVTIVGRGALTNMVDTATLAPIDGADGGLIRRIKKNIPVRCYSDREGACTTVDITSPPSNSFTLSTTQFMIAGDVGSGDSGAALLPQWSYNADRPRAVGVVSGGTYGADGVSNAAIAVRLDRHASWMKPAVRAAATTGGYAVPSWAK